MRKDEYVNIYRHHRIHWWYRGMAEINRMFLTSYAPRKDGEAKILDAGCGPGTAFWYLKEFGAVTGIDLSAEALRFARNMAPVIKGDITKLPFKENTFDVVVCMDVLYHLWVSDYRKALKEFYRVLRPRGILLVREPAYNWLKGSHDKVIFTKRRFQKKDMVTGLTDAGFTIQKVTHANFFLFPLILVKRLPEMVM